MFLDRHCEEACRRGSHEISIRYSGVSIQNKGIDCHAPHIGGARNDKFIQSRHSGMK